MHLNILHSRVREKKTSTTEVDYMVSYDGKINSVEAKSDTEGKVRSLHSFMDMAPHNLADRFNAGEWSEILEENEEGNLFQYRKDGY